MTLNQPPSTFYFQNAVMSTSSTRWWSLQVLQKSNTPLCHTGICYNRQVLLHCSSSSRFLRISQNARQLLPAITFCYLILNLKILDLNKGDTWTSTKWQLLEPSGNENESLTRSWIIWITKYYSRIQSSQTPEPSSKPANTSGLRAHFSPFLDDTNTSLRKLQACAVPSVVSAALLIKQKREPPAQHHRHQPKSLLRRELSMHSSEAGNVRLLEGRTTHRKGEDEQHGISVQHGLKTFKDHS